MKYLDSRGTLVGNVKDKEMIVETVAFPGFDPEDRTALVRTRYAELIASNAEASGEQSYEFATYETTRDFQLDPDGYRRKAELLQRFRTAEAERLQLGRLKESEFWDKRVFSEPTALYEEFTAWVDEYEREQTTISISSRLEIESADMLGAESLLGALLCLQSIEYEDEDADKNVLGKLWRAHDEEDFGKHALILAAFRAAIIDTHTDAGKSQGQANDEWESWLAETGASTVLARARDWFLEETSALEDQALGPPSS